MVEVAVMVAKPYCGMSLLSEALLGIVLERLPLGALLPVSTAAGTILAEAIAETAVHAVFGLLSLTIEQLVAAHLILERVTNLMADSRTDGLTGRGVHPEGTNLIVVA